MTLEALLSHVNDELVWVDTSAQGVDADLGNQAQMPRYTSPSARFIGVSENDVDPQFKMVFYADEDIVSVYKVKSGEQEAFNEEADDVLQRMYEQFVLNEDATPVQQEVVEPDPSLGHNDGYYIEKAMASYIDAMPSATIGDIFDAPFFSDIVWSVSAEAHITISGTYNGELFPGELAHLVFTLEEMANGQYTIVDMLYNERAVPPENYTIVTDQIEMVL